METEDARNCGSGWRDCTGLANRPTVDKKRQIDEVTDRLKTLIGLSYLTISGAAFEDAMNMKAEA